MPQPGPRLSDWLPASPPSPPLPRWLVSALIGSPMIQEYLADMEGRLGRSLTASEKRQEMEFWAQTVPMELLPWLTPVQREEIEREAGKWATAGAEAIVPQGLGPEAVRDLARQLFNRVRERYALPALPSLPPAPSPPAPARPRRRT